MRVFCVCAAATAVSLSIAGAVLGADFGATVTVSMVLFALSGGVLALAER